MLHLAVIGIVCAVSAPIEGTAFINQKNNASNVFCQFDGGEKDIVSLPDVYDVVVRNSSRCAGRKITNRTNSFFNEYSIKQYRDNKNSSCSTMESVFSGKKKRFLSNLMRFRGRRKGNPHSAKTLRPPLDAPLDSQNTETDQKHENAWPTRCKSDLNCNEKKIFFGLIRPTKWKKRKMCKGCKRHLDRLKVDDELDLNKRIEKLVKEIALENQRKGHSGKKSTGSDGIQDDYVERKEKPDNEKSSVFPFFSHIKKIFSFGKNYFNNKVNSVPTDSAQGKVLLSDKVAHISSYDLLKTMRKTTRFRRNPHANHIPYNTVYRNELIEKPCPHSAHFKGKRHFKHRRTTRRVIDDRRKRRKHRNMKKRKVKRRGKKVKTWPLFKNYPGYDLRLGRDQRAAAVNSNDISTPETAERNTDTEASQNEIPLNFDTNKGKTPSKGNESNEESSSLLTTSDQVTEDTVDSTNGMVMTSGDVPQQTLERPFLQRSDNLERTLHSSYSSMTELPLYTPVDFLLTSKYKYELPNEKYLTPNRYLQIRHALRSYLVHNNVFAPVKRTINPDRSKRCGKCNRPHKCWRSPPLLCIPYIKKGRDNQLKYLIRVMQSMVGKPFPPKLDIFDRTKYKPNQRNGKENSCDYDQGDDYSEYPGESNSRSKYNANANSPSLTSPSPQDYAANPPFPPHSTHSNGPTTTCPPMTRPPVTYPPMTRPPMTCPPMTRPPMTCPPMTRPPVTSPPMTRPPMTCPPMTGPPVTCPPLTRPPVTCPPLTRPPVTCPPMPRPPMTCPPMTCPPVTYPPMTRPPMISPPICYPPVTSPSVTCPPVTQPPVTYPPGTYPPVTYPPGTYPPVTYPPGIYPQGTCPPVNSPPDFNSGAACVSPLPVNSQRSNESFTPMSNDKECTSTEKTLMPGELPFPFPVMGQETDQSTSYNFDNCGTTQSQNPTTPSGKTPAANVPVDNSCSERTPPPMPTPSCKTDSPPNFFEGQSSEPPIEQKEYFSFSAYSYNGIPSYVTETYKYSKSSGLFTQPPPFPLCNSNQNYYPPRTICEGCYTTRHMPTNIPPPPCYPLSANPLASLVTQRFQPEILGPIKERRKEFHPEYILGTPYLKHDLSKMKPLNIPQIMRPHGTVMKSPMYEDVFNPPTEPNPLNEQMKYEIAQNRLFRMHHRETPNHNKNYDYDFYDSYPHENPKQKDTTFSIHPPPQGSLNEHGRKNRKVEKRGKLIRRKRGDDYYSWPEGPDNYNDYLDDPTYGDDYRKGMAPLNVENYGDSWTPPSYDMFSELAKAVTDTITDSNTSTTVSDKVAYTNKLPKNSGKTTIIRRTPVNDNGYGKIHDSINDQPLTRNHTLSHTSNHSCNFLNPDMKSTTPNMNSSRTPADSYDAATAEGSMKKKHFSTSSTKKMTESTKSDSHTTEYSSSQGDDPKGTKTVFFTSNTKPTEDGREDHSNGHSTRQTTVTSLKKGKETDATQNLDSADEGQMPTTLKMASIAKGVKKLATKPSPKVYTRVYPESFGDEPETNDTTRTTKVTKGATSSGKTTPLSSSTSAVDLKLQILSVCEGYLEVIKLIKYQHQTPAEALDLDLSRYCEDIISQSFNSDSQKSRRPDFAESSSQLKKSDDNSLNANSETGNDFFYGDIPDTTDDYTDDPETEETLKQKDSEIKKNLKNLNSVEASATESETSSETKKPESGERKKKKKKKKKKKRKNHLSAKEQQQQAKGEGEESLTTGVTREQVELIKLLRKRKNALLSWLLNARDHDKADDMQETEYFDDEDLIESDIPQDSGTVKPKRDEKTPGTTESKLSFVNESIFPVYAKQYGYDSGGEVREVEVLWRKVNEKTHEKKIYKNVSVLALLLSSTNAPNAKIEETKLVGSNGYESEVVLEIQSGKLNKTASAGGPAECKKSLPKDSKVSCPSSCVTNKTEQTCSPGKNVTRTVITKPDASCIVGKPPKTNKTRQNVTHKTSHRFGAAKDLFQEYSIEFLDYAVYILPVMFTILFLFCCLCCALHIFQAGKCLKRKKKKKKMTISSDDTTETTEESEFESKKRKRKRKSKEGCDRALDSRRGRKFWNVLKLHPSKGGSEATESSQTEKKKSFLRFLKCRKNEDKSESCCRIPLCEAEEIVKNSEDGLEGKHCHSQDSDEIHRGKYKSGEENEAAERRELIALLEELKKIETEHTEDKKEVKSVHVQYMTQEDENVFQRPEFSYPYEKNVFGLPKGYSFCSKQLPLHKAEPPAARGYELHEGVNELTELLPCECTYYLKRNDYCDFRINHEGRCKRFLNVFRDSGLSRCKPFVDKNCRKNESENRTFIFNKYRSMNTDEGDEFRGVTHKNAGTEVRFMENPSPFTFGPRNNADFVEEMENFTHELNVEKNTRQKDDGVLCRL